MDYEAIIALISNNVRTIMQLSEELAKLQEENAQLKVENDTLRAGANGEVAKTTKAARAVDVN